MIKVYGKDYFLGKINKSDGYFDRISDLIIRYKPIGKRTLASFTVETLESVGVFVNLTQNDKVKGIYQLYDKGIICFSELREELEAIEMVYGKIIISENENKPDNPQLEPLLRMVIKNSAWEINDNLVTYWANLFWEHFDKHVLVGDVDAEHKRNYNLQIEYARKSYYRNVISPDNSEVYFDVFKDLHERLQKTIGRHDYRTTFSLDCTDEPYHFSLAPDGNRQYVGHKIKDWKIK